MKLRRTCETRIADPTALMLSNERICVPVTWGLAVDRVRDLCSGRMPAVGSAQDLALLL